MLTQLRRGVAWTYAAIAIGAVIQLGVTAITARLLDPAAFGLVAMANVLMRFGGYVAQMGVGRALIQKPTIDRIDIRAAFTASTLLGLVVAWAIALSAPLAAAFYQSAEVVPVLRWLALTFVVAGLGATAQALLRRELRFRSSGAVEVLSYAVGYAVPALTMAMAGFGVWSLVAGAIGQSAMAGVLAYGLTRHPLRFTFAPKAHQRLLGFGAKVSLISFLEFIGSTLDTLVIGRFGTTAQVGLYNRAFIFASLPTYHLNNGITKVLFPVLSGGRNNDEVFRQTMHRVTDAAIKIVLSAGIGMALAAPELVLVVLGPKWADAIPLFAVLSVGLAINMLATFPGIALEAVGALRGKGLAQMGYVVGLAVVLVGATISKGLALSTVVLIIAAANTARTGAFFLLGLRAGVYDYRALFKHTATALLSACLGLIIIGGAVAVARACAWPQEAVVAAAVCAGIFQLALMFGWNRGRNALVWRPGSAHRKQRQQV